MPDTTDNTPPMEPAPKRGRGRPRKVLSPEELSRPKRGRGRPRKDASVAEPKRDRGRPRKDSTLEVAGVSDLAGQPNTPVISLPAPPEVNLAKKQEDVPRIDTEISAPSSQSHHPSLTHYRLTEIGKALDHEVQDFDRNIEDVLQQLRAEISVHTSDFRRELVDALTRAEQLSDDQTLPLVESMEKLARRIVKLRHRSSLDLSDIDDILARLKKLSRKFKRV